MTEVCLKIHYDSCSEPRSKQTSFTATVGKTFGPFCSIYLFSALSIIIWVLSGAIFHQWTMSSSLRNGLQLGILLLAVHWYVGSSVRVTEELLFLEDMGIQLTTKESRKQIFQLGRRVESVVREFIPLDKIRAVVINEGFKSFGVIHYLAVMVEENDLVKVKVVFPKILPRLPHLTKVWRAGSGYFNQEEG